MPGLYVNIETKMYTIFGPCKITGKDYSVTITEEQHHNWKGGMLIQDAMPNVPLEDREFLISGISPEGWKQLFPEEE